MTREPPDLQKYRDEFLQRLRGIAFYWSKIESPKIECLEGLCHSILCEIDGVGEGPGFKLIPMDADNRFDAFDICNGTMLHDEFYKHERNK